MGPIVLAMLFRLIPNLPSSMLSHCTVTWSFRLPLQCSWWKPSACMNSWSIVPLLNIPFLLKDILWAPPTIPTNDEQLTVNVQTNHCKGHKIGTGKQEYQKVLLWHHTRFWQVWANCFKCFLPYKAVSSKSEPLIEGTRHKQQVLVSAQWLVTNEGWLVSKVAISSTEWL